MSEVSIEAVVVRYVELRQQKAEIEAQHKEVLRPINEKMEVIENWLLDKLNKDGVESYRTEAGTAYKSKSVSCTMADRQIFLNYLLAPAVDAIVQWVFISDPRVPLKQDELASLLLTSGRWDLADLRVSKKGVQEEVEQQRPIPPGVNMNVVSTVNIRKA